MEILRGLFTSEGSLGRKLDLCFHPQEQRWRARASVGDFLELTSRCGSQVLLQEVSGFVFAAKGKVSENGGVATLRSVIRLCTQLSSRNRKVTNPRCPLPQPRPRV